MFLLGSVLVWVLAVLFAVVCLFMMLVILIQKPKGGGLSGAFGGAGGSADAAFGSKTGDVLTVVTVSCFVIFLLTAIGLQWTIRPEAIAAAQALNRVTTPAGLGDEPAQTEEDGPALPEGSADMILGDQLEDNAETDMQVDPPPVGDSLPNDAIFDDIQRGISDVQQNVEAPLDRGPGPDQPQTPAAPQE